MTDTAKKNLIRLFSLLNSLLLISCASTHDVTSQQTTFANAITEDDYAKIVETYSAKDEKYSGFYSAYKFQATILNSTVLEAQLSLKAQDFKWTREAYFLEKEKVSESLSKETQIFISFFSPVGENDNLDSNKTIWKLWLVSEGNRYEGTASKVPGILAQHQRLYPYHSRFFTPYLVHFKTPMGKTQTSPAKFILTGPIGTSEVEFRASSQPSSL